MNTFRFLNKGVAITSLLSLHLTLQLYLERANVCDLLLCFLSLHLLLHRLPPVKVIRVHCAIQLIGLLPLSQASSWTAFPHHELQLTRQSLLSLQLMSLAQICPRSPGSSCLLSALSALSASHCNRFKLGLPLLTLLPPSSLGLVRSCLVWQMVPLPIYLSLWLENQFG